VYQDSSFGIPAIYMNDWPDRYIHTNFDTAANIDTTKLKRAAFIGAASGYFLAQVSLKDSPAAFDAMTIGNLARETLSRSRAKTLSREEECVLYGSESMYDMAVRYSYGRLSEMPSADFLPADIGGCQSQRGTRARKQGPSPVFRRSAEPKGPLAVFGYDYFADHAKAAGVATPKLLGYEGLWGEGEEYAHEVLNFADGKRNAQEIRDAVSAEYGPVPVEMVVEYLRALEKIGLVAEVK
jgi:hypothetical protein